MCNVTTWWSAHIVSSLFQTLICLWFCGSWTTGLWLAGSLFQNLKNKTVQKWIIRGVGLDVPSDAVMLDKATNFIVQHFVSLREDSNYYIYTWTHIYWNEACVIKLCPLNVNFLHQKCYNTTASIDKNTFSHGTHQNKAGLGGESKWKGLNQSIVWLNQHFTDNQKSTLPQPQAIESAARWG